MAVCVVDLVNDLVARFGPEAKAFDGDAIGEEEVVTNEGDWRPFGPVGYTSGEVPADVFNQQSTLTLDNECTLT